MKIIEIRPRRKFVSGIVFDIEVDPKEYGADPDAAGLLSLDSELCEMKHLKSGMELTDAQVSALVRESHIKRAKSRALWYLSRGDCSRKTLFDKLKKAFPEFACEAACDRMEELRFLDDEAYAKRRLQRIIDEKKVSVRMAKQLLKQEGIDGDLIDDAVEVAEYDPIGTIVTLIERKYKNKLGDKAQNDKVIAALMRKGYSYSEIREALSQFDTPTDYCEDY